MRVFSPIERERETSNLQWWHDRSRKQTFQSHCSTWSCRMRGWMYRDWPRRHFHWKFRPTTIWNWRQAEVNIGWFLKTKQNAKKFQINNLDSIVNTLRLGVEKLFLINNSWMFDSIGWWCVVSSSRSFLFLVGEFWRIRQFAFLVLLLCRLRF